MKKTFTLALTIIACGLATTVMAGSRGCPGGGCRPCPPPPPCRPCGPGWDGCGWGWNCSRDLGNAAAITSIVANGVSILGNLTYPRTIVTQPVYTAPVVSAPAPVYTAPVVVPQPTYVAPAPVVVQPGGPLPPGLIVSPGVPVVRYGGGCVYY